MTMAPGYTEACDEEAKAGCECQDCVSLDDEDDEAPILPPRV